MRNRLVVAVALIVAIASPVYAQTLGEITKQEVEDALDRRREASSSLEEVTARFEQAVVVETQTRERIISLSKSVSSLEQEIGTKRSQVQDLVIARYMSSGSLGSDRVFSARTFTDLPLQEQYYQLANERDLALLRGLEAAEALHVEHQSTLAQSLEDQEALVEEIARLSEVILAQLERADAGFHAIAIAYEQQEEEKRRKAEEERQRREEEVRRAALEAAAEAARQATSTTTTAPTTTTTTLPTTTTTQPPSSSPVITADRTCPVDAASTFSDTWGAPRSGGRTHKGVDMMAVRNAPLVAIESGTITRTSNSSLGGISIYMAGESGSHYFYAHLEALAAGVQRGLSVSVGDVIGYNGSSGNSPNWLPHLHFQYAPPGSDWINPYPLVKALCG